MILNISLIWNRIMFIRTSFNTFCSFLFLIPKCGSKSRGKKLKQDILYMNFKFDLHPLE